MHLLKTEKSKLDAPCLKETHGRTWESLKKKKKKKKFTSLLLSSYLNYVC